MKFKNIFVLAARIIGLFMAISGLRGLVDLVFILWLGDVEFFFIAYIFAATMFYFLTGAYLLRGAPEVVKFAFRGTPDETYLSADE